MFKCVCASATKFMVLYLWSNHHNIVWKLSIKLRIPVRATLNAVCRTFIRHTIRRMTLRNDTWQCDTTHDDATRHFIFSGYCRSLRQEDNWFFNVLSHSHVSLHISCFVPYVVAKCLVSFGVSLRVSYVAPKARDTAFNVNIRIKIVSY